MITRSIVRDTSTSPAVPSRHVLSLQVVVETNGVGDAIKMTCRTVSLHEAVEGGHVVLVEELIRTGANLEAADEYGKRPLHLAIIHKHDKVLDVLIAHKCDVNSVVMGKSCVDGKTARLSPLYLAVECRHTTAFEALIRAGADVDAVNAEATPLQICATLNSTKLAGILIDKQARVDETRGNLSALHQAVINRNIEMTEFLLTRGASVNIKELCLGATPLHLAVVNCELNMVELLVRHGADTNVRATYLDTPLSLSVKRNVPEILEFLLGNGARIHNYGKYCHLIQIIVAKSNTEQVFKILLKNGIRFNGRMDLNTTALHAITSETDKEVIQILLDRNVKFNLADKYRLYPVHYAALAGHEDGVQLLLGKGVPVDCCGRNNWTPLHLAAGAGYGRLVEVLLEKGADVNKKDVFGRTALCYALRGLPISPRLCVVPEIVIPNPLAAETMKRYGVGQINKKSNVNASRNGVKVDANTVATILIRNGAQFDLNIFDALQKLGDVVVNGQTVSYSRLKIFTDLFKGIVENKVSLVKACIKKAAVVDCVARKFGTPLTYTCKVGSCQVVEALLASGANPNFKTKTGMTPLHFAAQQGDTDMVISLLWKGAMYDAQNNLRRKPIYYAMKGNNADIANLLRKVEHLFQSAINGNRDILSSLTILKYVYALKRSDLGIDKNKCLNQLDLFFVIKNSGGENLAQVAQANNNSMFVHYVWDALQIK